MGDGLAHFTLRHENGTQPALRVGVVGRLRKQTPVIALGLRQRSSAMMRDSVGEQFCRVSVGRSRRQIESAVGTPLGSPLLAVHG
ncbi:MAG: hypothetical protein WA280_19875, partial [Xanthobacteraceae bacterium]